MKTNLATLENIGLRYSVEKEILRDISFSLNEGDFIFLIGESGAGKSTFLNLLNISLLPSRGFLNVLGVNINKNTIKDRASIRREIGNIFQDFKLIPELNIFENIALPLKIMGINRLEIATRVNEMLDWIGLEEYVKASPLTLSGGQQQRVAIARAVISKPKIILADEPTGSIDYKMSDKIIKMLGELNKQGVAVIFATHNLELLEKNNYPIALLQKGKLKIVKNISDMKQ